MPVYLRKMEQLPKQAGGTVVFLFTMGFLINQAWSLKLASFSRITIKGNYGGGKDYRLMTCHLPGFVLKIN